MKSSAGSPVRTSKRRESEVPTQEVGGSNTKVNWTLVRVPSEGSNRSRLPTKKGVWAVMSALENECATASENWSALAAAGGNNTAMVRSPQTVTASFLNAMRSPSLARYANERRRLKVVRQS